VRTDQVAKIALTVALVSLLGNYAQFLHARAKTRAQELEVARLHIEHRKESMLERAAAFYTLVLGSQSDVPSSHRSGMEGDEYKVEYAVQIPQQKHDEFAKWMSGAKPPQFSVNARAYAHESALRLVQSNGREVEELYETFAITLR
jgi:hypothetical protein